MTTPGVRERDTTLSKSRYVAGLQCERRLWLAVHRSELREPPDAAQQARFDAGNLIGAHAHRLFPGGVLVAEGPDRFPEALARTQTLLVDATVPAIFEAAFEYAGVRVRVDVLERREGGRFALVEVKSGTKRKDHLFDDVAVQRFVLEGAGVPLEDTALLLVDSTYVRGSSGIDWPGFFRRDEVASEVGTRMAAVAPRVESQQALVAGSSEPDVAPGGHCKKPHVCPFWKHCTTDKPEDWVQTLPRVGDGTVQTLRGRGIERIRDIPDDVKLNPMQTRVRDVWRAGRPWVDPQLGAALAPLGPPAWYLDFETVVAALPIWPQTRPYEAILFQWSVHHVDTDGRVADWGYLADGNDDPRRALAESLIARLGGDEAPILVYSDYERRVIGELAKLLPDLVKPLAAIRARLQDLLRVVRAHVYLSGFGGSFSIKRVAPALAPGFAWSPPDAEGSAITEGASASAAFARIVQGEVDAGEEGAIVRSLQAYCRHDTRALVVVHEALRGLAARSD